MFCIPQSSLTLCSHCYLLCCDFFNCNHRDIQATSVLLDDKFEVRLGSMSDVCAQQSGGSQSVFSRLLRSSRYDYDLSWARMRKTTLIDGWMWWFYNFLNSRNHWWPNLMVLPLFFFLNLYFKFGNNINIKLKVRETATVVLIDHGWSYVENAVPYFPYYCIFLKNKNKKGK